MEDLLWSTTQQSRVLLDLRKDIRPVWRDEAARELTSRYLDPHESEDQQMLAGFNRQKEALDEARIKLVSAADYGRQATEKALLAAERLTETEQELNSAYGDYDIYVHYRSEARSKFSEIQTLINQANQACTA
jgi:beta-phosphoglucomutase-like phosphatase (HAD superfamily)